MNLDKIRFNKRQERIKNTQGFLVKEGVFFPDIVNKTIIERCELSFITSKTKGFTHKKMKKRNFLL
jgi:hypothetical protein